MDLDKHYKRDNVDLVFIRNINWIAKVDITTQAVGVIVPEKNITQLGTMVTGEIVAVNYKQGDVVKKGDVIITINPGVGYEPYNIKANIDGKIQQLTYLNPGSLNKILY